MSAVAVVPKREENKESHTLQQTLDEFDMEWGALRARAMAIYNGPQRFTRVEEINLLESRAREIKREAKEQRIQETENLCISVVPVCQ